MDWYKGDLFTHPAMKRAGSLTCHCSASTSALKVHLARDWGREKGRG